MTPVLDRYARGDKSVRVIAVGAFRVPKMAPAATDQLQVMASGFAKLMGEANFCMLALQLRDSVRLCTA